MTVLGGHGGYNRTQIWRVPSPLNSTETGVAPRSDAIEKYANDPVVNTTTAIWWNRRAPRGLCQLGSCQWETVCYVQGQHTLNVHPTTASRETPKIEKAAQSQSDPPVER